MSLTLKNFRVTNTSNSLISALKTEELLNTKADLVSGLVPANQLPSYVDEIFEGYIDLETNKFYSDPEKTTEISVESGKIYMDLTTNLQYRFGGTTFAVMSSSLALGETADTAFPGNRGKALEQNKVDKLSGKGLSTEDYTTADRTKLNGIETGAQINKIENIKVNGSNLTITNKSVNIIIPTTLTELTEKSYNSLTDKPNLSLKADLVEGIIPINQLPSYIVEYCNDRLIRETSGQYIMPIEHVIYRHVLQENDLITIDPYFHLDENNGNKCVTFELWLDMPQNPITFNFSSSFMWISKFAPDFSVGNMRYVIVIRWTGINYITNLAYTEPIE